jgi:regulator of sigma E protease
MLLTIITFVIILAILVFVHEFGHFIVAKKSGMQVEEFGFGFPPRIAGMQKIAGKWKILGAGNKNIDPGTTVYSINWIPLGGFVRILGENNEDENHPGSFINKGFWPRFFTLIAGVLMNVILAWVILSIGFIIGLPVAVDSATDIPAHTTFSQPQTAILDVEPGSAADKAGVEPNDILLSLNGQYFQAVADIQNYVKNHEGQPVIFQVQRGKQDLNLTVTPSPNPPAGQGPTGIELSLVGRLSYPWYSAIWEGAKSTISGIGEIFSGFYELFKTHAGFSALGGPVKIAQLTGQVEGLGFVYLLQFMAFLSLNLAVLNIIPFPALDGGRILFLLIEKIRRKRNNQKIEQIVNTAGFVFLLLLMVAVTVNDIIRR